MSGGCDLGTYVNHKCTILKMTGEWLPEVKYVLTLDQSLQSNCGCRNNISKEDFHVRIAEVRMNLDVLDTRPQRRVALQTLNCIDQLFSIEENRDGVLVE